ncbi:MAG: hypothetical protein RL141_295 [Candidatus Parcubacteria bacterium]|jgi:protein-disulfide isomerase
MQNQSSDPRQPILIGMIVLGVILLVGIVWAVVSAPASSGGNNMADPNLSFRDENDPALGPEDAKVMVRVFGDFECPACRSAEPGITHVREAYADRVRVIWNDFPLPATMHPKARISATAARCAEEQAKFWEMHDLLYETQSGWARSTDANADFESLARRIGLHEGGFRSCMSERRHDSKVTNDLQEGQANGVDSTPTFFVNNVKYVGVLSPAQWDAILKPLLEAAEAPAVPEEAAGEETATVETE